MRLYTKIKFHTNPYRFWVAWCVCFILGLSGVLLFSSFLFQKISREFEQGTSIHQTGNGVLIERMQQSLDRIEREIQTRTTSQKNASVVQ